MSRPPDGIRPLKLLRATLGAEPRELAAMVAMLLGVWLCELTLPFLLGGTVDSAISRSGGIPVIARLGATALCVAAVLYVLHNGYLQSEVRLIAHGAFRLRQRLYTHILEQPLDVLSNLRKSEAVQRIINDAEVLDSHAIYLLADLPFSLLTVVGAFLVMLWMQPLLAILVLAVLATVAALANRVARPLGTFERAFLHRRAWLGQRLQECLDAFRLVKTFGRETQQREQLDLANGRLMDAQIDAGHVEARLEPLVQLMETLGFLAVVWYGAALVLFASLTPGALVSFIAYMALMREPIRDAGSYYAHYRQSAAVLARIAGFLNQLAPTVIDGHFTQDGPFSIELQNICLNRSDGDRRQLLDVSFSAKPGEIIGITGENGAGKSTLLDVLLGLVAPDSGWVLAAGVPLDDWNGRAWRSATAAVPQEPFLFHATIAENIRYGRPQASEAELLAVATLAGLDEVIARLPHGLRTVVGDRGSMLSGGERQRIALARALIGKPRLLVLDEPCSALDETAQTHAHRALLASREGRITFIVSHDWQALARTDRVIVLDAGRVRCIGSAADLGRTEPGESFEKSAA